MSNTETKVRQKSDLKEKGELCCLGEEIDTLQDTAIQLANMICDKVRNLVGEFPEAERSDSEPKSNGVFGGMRSKIDVIKYHLERSEEFMDQL